MNSETQLDNRLRLCAEFVRPGARAADIGTDHAYLPVWLCRHNICPSAIAADVNPEPLSRGRITVAQAGMEDKISLRLSDGLAQIAEDEVDDIIIAGMGGELIADIITACPYAADKHFICVAGKKCYTVLSVVYGGTVRQHDELYRYTGELHPRENETHLRFLRGHIKRLRKQAKGEARFAALADRLEEFCGNG